MRLLAFFKREAVLTVAALCALATMVLVPPDAAYLGYRRKDHYRKLQQHLEAWLSGGYQKL